MEETNLQPEQNKMGTMPVPKLLLNMGAPMMLSMLGQALYNVVDTYFVSHISGMGDQAINALTLAYPIQMLIIALGVGTGVGVNAMLSQSLGKKDREQASRIAGNAVLISLCYFAIIFVFGLTSAKGFIESQTKETIIATMGTTYLRIVTVFSLGTIGFMCLEKIVMATGNTRATMVGQLAGAITNIVLDPILIYGYMGCPQMGVAGAAWATVIGQFISLFILAWIHFRNSKEIDNSVNYLRPCKNALKGIFSIGFPSIVMQILAPVMSYSMNLILGTISVSAVTAYGVYYKLQNFIFMPAYGLNNASIPIISYNFGAKERNRVFQAIRYGLICVTAIMLAGIVLLQVFANQIVGIFSIAEESTYLCVLALRIVTLGFCFAGGNIILQGVCQALGNGIYSLIISLLRLIIIVLPLAYAFSRMEAGSTIVWLALPIAEGIACIVAVVLTKIVYKTNSNLW